MKTQVRKEPSQDLVGSAQLLPERRARSGHKRAARSRSEAQNRNEVWLGELRKKSGHR